MSVMSKTFYECTRNMTCKDIVHPWTDSCWKLRQKAFLSSIPGNLKFFLPFIIIPAMLKIKSFNLQMLRESLIHYALVFFNGMFIANSIIFSACMWRNLFGRYYYHFVVGVSGFFASLPLIFLPKRIAMTHVIYIYGLAFESVIRKNNSTFVSWLRKSKLAGTFAFMAMSGLIMDLQKRMKNNNLVFWFLHPETKSRDDNNNLCEHKGGCYRYILNGLTSYAAVGIIFEFVKYGFFHAGKLRGDAFGFFFGLLRKINTPLVRFLTSMAGIYRIVHCGLVKNNVTSSRVANFIAGTLSGASYYTATEYSVYNVAATSLAQLLVHDFQRKPNLKGILKKLQTWSMHFPLRMIIFVLTFPVAVHSRMFYPYTLNRLALKCIDYTSGKAAYLAGENIHKLWLNPDF